MDRNTCPICTKAVSGKATYCSAACKQLAYRNKTKHPTDVTKPSGATVTPPATPPNVTQPAMSQNSPPAKPDYMSDAEYAIWAANNYHSHWFGQAPHTPSYIECLRPNCTLLASPKPDWTPTCTKPCCS